MSFLSNGQACPAAAPFLAGANLVAVPKPKGGLRPIAIGEVLRRLTGAMPDGIGPDRCPRKLLRCTDWGCCSGGCGSCSSRRPGLDMPGPRSMPKPAARFSLNWTLQMHSTLSPANKSWPSARSQFPFLSRGVHWCYGEASYLQFGGSLLQSAGGVQQGDPLGPLSVCRILPLQCSRLPRSFSKAPWTSPPSTLMMASLLAMWAQSRLLSVLCNNVWLTSASTLTSRNVRLSASARSRLPNLSPTSLTASCAMPMAPAASIATSSCSEQQSEMMTLMLPTHRLVSTKPAPFLKPSVNLRTPKWHSASALLRRACPHRPHSVRCTPPAARPDALTAFDLKVRSCFSSFSGIHLDSTQWEQATRSFTQASLCLRSAARDASAAYLASVGSTSERATAASRPRQPEPQE